MIDDDGEAKLALSVRISVVVNWVARRRAAPRDLAEEAVQEALLQLLELSTRGRPRDVEGWLRRVAERRLIDADRHRRTQLPAAESESVEEQAADGVDLDAVLAFRAALRGLDGDLRRLVVRRLSGASWREISVSTGLGEEAARKRFERALVDLRAAMDGLQG